MSVAMIAITTSSSTRVKPRCSALTVVGWHMAATADGGGRQRMLSPPPPRGHGESVATAGELFTG